MEIELKGAGVQYYSTNFQFFVLKFELKKSQVSAEVRVCLCTFCGEGVALN